MTDMKNIPNPNPWVRVRVRVTFGLDSMLANSFKIVINDIQMHLIRDKEFLSSLN